MAWVGRKELQDTLTVTDLVIHFFGMHIHRIIDYVVYIMNCTHVISNQSTVKERSKVRRERREREEEGGMV